MASDIVRDSRAGVPGPLAFATTHWSVVLAAGNDSVQSMAALEQLCKAYWYPIYAHVRRRVFRTENAQDMTQEVFAASKGKEGNKAPKCIQVPKMPEDFPPKLITLLHHFPIIIS